MADSFYEQMADEFMSSLAGQLSGVSRKEFIDKLKSTYPDEKDAQARFERAKAIIEESMADFLAKINNGESTPAYLDTTEAELLLMPSKSCLH